MGAFIWMGRPTKDMVSLLLDVGWTHRCMCHGRTLHGHDWMMLMMTIMVKCLHGLDGRRR